jgi:hypothetical protein
MQHSIPINAGSGVENSNAHDKLKSPRKSDSKSSSPSSDNKNRGSPESPLLPRSRSNSAVVSENLPKSSLVVSNNVLLGLNDSNIIPINQTSASLKEDTSKGNGIVSAQSQVSDQPSDTCSTAEKLPKSESFMSNNEAVSIKPKVLFLSDDKDISTSLNIISSTEKTCEDIQHVASASVGEVLQAVNEDPSLTISPVMTIVNEHAIQNTVLRTNNDSNRDLPSIVTQSTNMYSETASNLSISSKVESYEDPAVLGSSSVDASNDVDSNNNVDGRGDNDLSPVEDEEDSLIEIEMGRIDKEAGHARRAFESRIQKHKVIQVISIYWKSIVI